MIQRYFCCFTSKPKTPNVIDLTTGNKTDNKNNTDIDNIDVTITNNEPESKIDYGSLKKPICLDNRIKFVQPIKKGLVIKVYDGDTILIASKLTYSESPLYRYTVRLNGIDSPEMKSKNESEKTCALISQKELSNIILNKVVTLQNIQTDKYGRILADVYLKKLHLNNYMLNKRLAVVYDGGTKISPKNWLNYHHTGEL